MKQAIRAFIGDIPPHIVACANAVRYDLLYGPAWACIPQCDIAKFTDDHLSTLHADAQEMAESGDSVQQVYSGLVADTLRDWIQNAAFPTYYDADADDCTDSLPEGEWLNADYESCKECDDDAEWHEPCTEFYHELSQRDCIEALFGGVVAREFNY